MLNKTSSKYFAMCVIMTLCSTTAAFARCAEKPTCPPKRPCNPKPVCPPEPCCEPVKCPSIEDDCCMRNVCTPTGKITPRVDLIKGDTMGWFVTGDYTFWTASEDNLEFAVTRVSNGPTAVDKGKVYHPSKEWNSGFKVGLGTVTCHDGWDVYAEYTWFNSKNTKHTGVTTPAAYYDIYWVINFDDVGGPRGGLPFNSGNAKWDLNMNVVDLELGRNFYVSPRLMLRPFYGLKGTWQSQKMDVQFASGGILFQTDNKIHNWGIGVRGGMDTSWHFSRSFSIIGDMAFSGLYEHFKVTRFDTDNLTGIFINKYNLVEKSYLMKPVIEWSLGMKWETGFLCDARHFSIAVAWEQQYWFGQNKFLRTLATAAGTGGDLNLQGLTVDLRFDF